MTFLLGVYNRLSGGHILNWVAKFPLSCWKHEAVSGVTHPALPAHPDHELARRLLPAGAGAVFSFEIAGGREAGVRLIESLNIFSHLANVGDAKSLVIHPASTTHSRMDEPALAAAGISPGLVRLSIGLEDPADLIDDLGRALARARSRLRALTP